MASPTYMTSPLTMNTLEPPSTAPLNMPKRRMTSPSLVPPESSTLTEPANERRDLRPPSPLRNGITFDPSTGEFSDHGSSHQTEEDDFRQWGQRSHSPSPSVTQFATDFVQKVGSFVGGVAPRRKGLPTDAELEAEAERERQQSMLEAERIIMRENAERKMMEEKILAMIEESMVPPTKSHLSNPPSPSSSNKEGGGGWLSAVKNKLTPTKEPLTPAQQIIQETKAREKEKKKTKDKDWPSSSNGKFSDPAYVALASSSVTPPRPLAQSFTSSPTGVQRPISQIQTSDWSPAISRTGDSPSREGPPVYAQFNAQGTLDVSTTLITVAKRFEKLEKWTVSHVRALEERMSDVEKWLVDKEKERDLEKEHATSQSDQSSLNNVTKHENDDGQDMSEIREELVELQGRVTVLGREMAKFASSTRNMSSTNSASIPALTSSTTSPVATSSGRSLPAIPATVTRTPSNSSSVVQSRGVSPTFSSNASAVKSRTRLPYPTGDYAASPNSILASEEILSPTVSPPTTLMQSSNTRPRSVSGLPTSNVVNVLQSSSTPIGAYRAISPVMKENETISRPVNRTKPISVSPTPIARKRYTVALGGSLVPPDSRESVSPSPSTENKSKLSNDDTIGKSAMRMISSTTSTTPYHTPGNPRARAQSTYGTPTGYSSLSPSPSSSPSTTSPLKLRLRTRSTDHLAQRNKTMGLGISDTSTGKFVDPLVVRRQERESATPIRSPKVTNARSKVPFGELLAFFDGDHRNA